MKTEIKALERTVEIQKDTIVTMEKRILETEKIWDLYQKLLSDLPRDIDNYLAVIAKTKNAAIEELEYAINLKDEKLKLAAKDEVRRIEILELVLTELPKVRKEMAEVSSKLEMTNLLPNTVMAPSYRTESNRIPKAIIAEKIASSSEYRAFVERLLFYNSGRENDASQMDSEQ